MLITCLSELLLHKLYLARTSVGISGKTANTHQSIGHPRGSNCAGKMFLHISLYFKLFYTLYSILYSF